MESLTSPFTMSPADLERVLGRAPRPLGLDEPLHKLARERVLVTGAAGSIGVEIAHVLEPTGCPLLATDVDTLDVRDARAVMRAFRSFRPTVVYHLAGAKHAPEGEIDPLTVMEVNAQGTANLVAAGATMGAKIVTASTCKSCDPETAYGASKLIAERMTLQAGGNVARFYNVVETAGNVFEIWSEIPASQPLPVTPCHRFFITLAEARALVLRSGTVGHGRYTLDPGEARWMPDVAAALYPERELVTRPPRRGDRDDEPRKARCETITPVIASLERVSGPHDATGASPEVRLRAA
jgi:FlaA1/EpsC-like NDP-sugar epimerase